MYITSDLFEPQGRVEYPPATTTTHPRNNMTASYNTTELGKRKRRDDADEGPSTSHSVAVQQLPATSGRASFKFSHGSPELGSRTIRLSPKPLSYARSETRPFKQLRRTGTAPAKIELVKIPSFLMDIEPDPPSGPNVSTTLPVCTSTSTESDLRACHICHTAPKRKKELENYLQCHRCEQRACYVCARECSAGCQKQLCSKCCVEVGEEGDTYCLGCYQRNVNAS